MEHLTTFKKWVYRNLAVIFLLLGILILYFSSTYPFDPNKSDFWKDFYEKIGLSIFSSGVFAAVLKSIQFTGLFKEEIEKVMLSTDFIKNRSDLTELWKKVSDAVYKSKFPILKDELNDVILNTYFPTNEDFYYKDFIVTINIEKLTEDDFIEFTQTVKFNVVLSDDINETIIESRVSVDKESKESEIINNRIYCKLNDKDIDPEVELLEYDNVINRRYDIKIKKSGTSKIEIKDRRKYSIKNDNVKLLRVYHITKDMDVSVHYPDNMKVSFFNIGLVNNFEQIHTEHENHISRRHTNGIILPKQGFGLSFRKK